MPYAIRKSEGTRPWKIIRKDTGEQVGAAYTKADAEASVRARYAAEHGHAMGKPLSKR